MPKFYTTALQLLLSACFCSMSVFAQEQNEPLIIDAFQNKYPRSFPFDKPFDLTYIPKTKVNIRYVGLFGIDRKGCLSRVESLKCTMVEIKNESPELSRREIRKRAKKSISSTTLYDDKTDTSTTGVKFSMPALKPNKQYMLVFLSQKRIEGIQRVVDSLQKYFPDSAQAKPVYEKIKDETLFIFPMAQSNNCNDCSKPFIIADFSEFYKFYATVLKNDVDGIAAKQASLQTSTGSSPVLSSAIINLENIDSFVYRDAIEYTEQCLYCKDSLWKSEFATGDKTNVIIPLLRLGTLNDTALALGLTNIYTSSVASGNNLKQEERMQNLVITTTALIKLKDVVNYYNLRYPGKRSAYQSFLTELQNAINILKANYQLLANWNNSISELRQQIAKLERRSDSVQQSSELFFRPISSFSSGTYTYNFETRTGFLIKPDFGFMYYGSLTGKTSFRGFAPYLGFHINFRPLDTNIPFGAIKNEGVAAHLSFNAGALIGSFSEAGKRDGLIGNTAIFTGLGWAFTDWLRLTSGSVWYRKEESNPLKSRKTTAAIPYASISIDLRLQDIYKSFTNIFTP